MKLGLLSAAFPNLSLKQFVEWAAGNGFEMISIEHQDPAFEKTEDFIRRGFLIARDALRPYIH